MTATCTQVVDFLLQDRALKLNKCDPNFDYKYPREKIHDLFRANADGTYACRLCLAAPALRLSKPGDETNFLAHLNGREHRARFPMFADISYTDDKVR